LRPSGLAWYKQSSTSEFLLNDVVTIISGNDVLNVVTYALACAADTDSTRLDSNKGPS
jgi:hypothetical protein